MKPYAFIGFYLFDSATKKAQKLVNSRVHYEVNDNYCSQVSNGGCVRTRIKWKKKTLLGVLALIATT